MAPRLYSFEEAVRRREADREELKRAITAEDWGAAFDVLHANVHEVESLSARIADRVDGLLSEVAALGRAWEDANAKLGGVLVTLQELRAEARAAKDAADGSSQHAAMSAEKAAAALVAEARATAALDVERRWRAWKWSTPIAIIVALIGSAGVVVTALKLIWR